MPGKGFSLLRRAIDPFVLDALAQFLAESAGFGVEVFFIRKDSDPGHIRTDLSNGVRSEGGCKVAHVRQNFFVSAAT